jgi:HSP20 family protein
VLIEQPLSSNAVRKLGIVIAFLLCSRFHETPPKILFEGKETMAKVEKSQREEGKGLTAWRPRSEVARMQRQMERMFEDFFHPRWSPFRGTFWPTREQTLSSVDVDVYEDKNEIVVKAELPAMEKDNIDVNVSDHVLTIRGEKKKEAERKEEEYYFSERSYGSFARSIELPAEVQTEGAKANFKNGILEIRLPRTEGAKSKQISVNVEG